MRYSDEMKKFQELLDQTIRLISLYYKYDLKKKIPAALIGNIGEFSVMMKLMEELEEFPEYRVNYKGGAFPEADITIGDEIDTDKIKIQAKTQIKQFHKHYDYESAPTINRATIEDKKCHIIILQILYPDNLFRKIEKTNTYVFDQDDFKYFSHIGCWTGKSKGDYTIFNILKVFGNPPPKLKDEINHYNNKAYHDLFQNAKDNWEKIKKLLTTK